MKNKWNEINLPRNWGRICGKWNDKASETTTITTNEALPRANIVQFLYYLLKFRQLYSELVFAVIQISGELWHNRKY